MSFDNLPLSQLTTHTHYDYDRHTEKDISLNPSDDGEEMTLTSSDSDGERNFLVQHKCLIVSFYTNTFRIFAADMLLSFLIFFFVYTFGLWMVLFQAIRRIRFVSEAEINLSQPYE